jgi:ACT domain-containing protein
MRTFQPTATVKSFNTVAVHAIGDERHKRLQAYLTIVLTNRETGQTKIVKNRQGKPVVATVEANSIIQLDHILRGYVGNGDVDAIIQSIEKLDEFEGVPYVN